MSIGVGGKMSMTRGVSFMIIVSSLALLPAGCSRTSDGTIVADPPVSLPSLSLPRVRPIAPAWMSRQQPAPEPDMAAANFPPPPETERPAPRRKARPPVVRSSAGNLQCENKTDGGRVRMVCQ